VQDPELAVKIVEGLIHDTLLEIRVLEAHQHLDDHVSECDPVNDHTVLIICTGPDRDLDIVAKQVLQVLAPARSNHEAVRVAICNGRDKCMVET
jgi:hypothetical protein